MNLSGQKDSRRGSRCARLSAGLRAASLAALPAAAACVLAPAQTRAASGPPRVVVADIDSGINVYHSFLYAGGELYKTSAPSSVTPEVLAAFRIDAAHQIQLTRTGNSSASRASRRRPRRAASPTRAARARSS